MDKMNLDIETERTLYFVETFTYLAVSIIELG